MLPVALITICGNAIAWDFTAKGDFQRYNTSNVNLTNTAPISDTVNAVSGYLQTKNEKYRIKLRGKKEQYANQVANDNYFVDLSLQYKHSKINDYTISIFKQVYNGASIVSTDTTSDNTGAKISATFSKEFGPETSGYITPTFGSKTYPKIANRTDKIYSGAIGLEHNFSSTFMINPELDLQKNNSSDGYYENSSWGPLLSLSYTPDDNWEFFADASYVVTEYQGRTVTTTAPRGRSGVEYESQKLTTTDVGMAYNFAQYIGLQVKYMRESNTSNSTTTAYKANVTSFNISLKI